MTYSNPHKLSSEQLSPSKLSKREKRKGWMKFGLFMTLLSITVFIIGFITFATKVNALTPPSHMPKADGIVVWTGKGGGRLETGAELLRKNKGERLLISGVNKTTTMGSIKKLVELSDSTADCCVDLDYKAEDTAGNARETANWVKALGYEHIILVTSAYHMPRAEIEINAAIGRVKITPYPVIAKDRKHWLKNGGRFKRLFQEYGKLLLTYIKEPSTRDKRGAPYLDTPPHKPVKKDEAK